MDDEATPGALRLTDGLGLPPAYLADGQTAYAAGIVASWPAHNQARFRTLLFTGAQLEAAVTAERELAVRVMADMLEAAGAHMLHNSREEDARTLLRLARERA